MPTSTLLQQTFNMQSFPAASLINTKDRWVMLIHPFPRSAIHGPLVSSRSRCTGAVHLICFSPASWIRFPSWHRCTFWDVPGGSRPAIAHPQRQHTPSPPFCSPVSGYQRLLIKPQGQHWGQFQTNDPLVFYVFFFLGGGAFTRCMFTHTYSHMLIYSLILGPVLSVTSKPA